MNYKATIQYKGTQYCGFSRQDKERSVEGELRKALKALLKEETRVNVAGRTDAGVHALEQVISFKGDTNIETKKLQYRLNAILPLSIKITQLIEIDDDFDARRSAVGRQYAYYILNRRLPSVFNDDLCLHYPSSLDMSLMNKAARALVGKNNFKAFSAASSENKVYVRDIKSLSIENESPFFDISNKEMIKVTIKSNAFLHKMVRIIVGTLIDVGREYLMPEDVGLILKSKDREKAGPTAAAKGLFLEKVFY